MFAPTQNVRSEYNFGSAAPLPAPTSVTVLVTHALRCNQIIQHSVFLVQCLIFFTL